MQIIKYCNLSDNNKIMIENLNKTEGLNIYFSIDDAPFITRNIRINKESMLEIAREIIQHYAK